MYGKAFFLNACSLPAARNKVLNHISLQDSKIWNKKSIIIWCYLLLQKKKPPFFEERSSYGRENSFITYGLHKFLAEVLQLTECTFKRRRSHQRARRSIFKTETFLNDRFEVYEKCVILPQEIVYQYSFSVPESSSEHSISYVFNDHCC